MEKDKEAPTQLFIVLGFERLHGGKAGWAVSPVTEEELNTAHLSGSLVGSFRLNSQAYQLKVGKKYLPRVGGVYRVPTPSEGTIQPGKAVFHCEWPVAKDRLALFTDQRARQRQFEAEKRINSENKRNLLHEALDPARHAYRKCSSMARHQLLAEMVEYITRP